ncbi:MAG: KR domain-containing protein [Firmicutes bacterium]|nr:KR domain-containing protein [Bacillota bacterium]
MYNFKQNEKEGIAVIGLAGRFPGAENVEQYWHNICNGIESISFFSDEELLESGIDPELIKKPNFIKARGVLGNTDLIDAQFFGLHAREAALMDPQHRLFLECAWKAFESAGYCPDNHQGRVGIFGGSSMNTYMLHNLLHLIRNVESVESLQVSIGNDKDSLTTEVAYRLNLKGPAVTIQSSSSTSLTAVHYACQSLLNYESDMALAGGVSVHFPEKSGYLYMEGGTTSSDGHCRAFDAAADGFVAGHGAGVVLLKRVADALADGDTIWAVIKGSAVNNDGAVRVSYMAPGVEGQSEVFAIAQAIAGVTSEDISYIEAHGTGTRVGDPIEMTSLKQVFEAVTDKKNFCAIGSVKPNIGHLDSASGIAGLIKTVLMLKHKKIPPHINFTTPNPELDLENSPFYINPKLCDWDSTYRIAGVNSFGMGGTNTHIIVAEPPEAEQKGNPRSASLLLLSAKTETALEKATRNLVRYLETDSNVDLGDVSYTLHAGRNRFDYRRALVCTGIDDAVQALKSVTPERVFTDAAEGAGNRLVFFLFPDELTRFEYFTTDTYRDIPLFKSSLDTCLEYVSPFLTTDLKKYFYAANQEEMQASLEEINKKGITPLVIFTIEYALAQVLLDWGIKPQGMLGQGVGEYVAACLSEVMSLQDALSLVININNIANNFSPINPSVFNEPMIPFLSGLSGNWITKAEATDSLYWQQRHEAVGFIEIIKSLLADSAAILLEVNSGTELTDRIKREILAENLDLGKYQLLNCSSKTYGYRTEYAALLETVGRLWLAGCNPDIEKLHHPEGDISHRIPLPTYPFEYKSHWVEPVKMETKDNEAELPPEDLKMAPENWFYAPAWKKENFNIDVASVRREGPYLVLLPEQTKQQNDSLIDQCINILKGHDLQVIIVSFGPNFARLTSDHYQMNPLVFEDYERLIEDLNQNGLEPGNVIDFRSLYVSKRDGVNTDYLSDCLANGFNSLLFLVKAIEQGTALNGLSRKNMLFTIISSQTLDVSGIEPISPEKTTLLGACKVIPQEYSHITCRYLDVVLPVPGSVQEKQLVMELTQEVMYGATENQVIACRGGQRFIQTVEALRLPKTGGKPLLKADGVYLILGGLGTIGYCSARALAKQGKVKLALTGSTSLPEKEQWDAWLLAHGEDDPISSKIKKLQVLDEMDCEVIYLKADLLDAEQMKAALQYVKTRFKGLNGVIDAAGAVNDEIFKPIRNISFRDPAGNLKTKWNGLYVLKEVLKEETLDFCLLCSSLSAMLGGLGLAEYAAGNLFMDAFANSCNQSSTSFWMSVNWDAFSSTSLMYKDFGTPLLDLAITAEEGEDTFIRIFSNYPLRNQYLVSTSSLDRRLRRWTLGNQDSSRTDANKQPLKKENVARLPRPALQNSYIAPQTKLEKELAEVWGRVLGLESVGINDNFFELGGNSLVGVELIADITNRYNYQLSSLDIYESPTIKMLSSLILSRNQGTEDDTEQIQKSLDRGQKRRERILRNK